ncbi:hypothetical protein, partial [Mycobacteroides abscessus]|uniref:hypothetical protein n=1 Tax=Mycobacteroides abscessus TaxID=36809 RepID=UPI001A95BDC5
MGADGGESSSGGGCVVDVAAWESVSVAVGVAELAVADGFGLGDVGEVGLGLCAFVGPGVVGVTESPWKSRRLGLLDFDQGLVGPLGIVERGFELCRG